MSASEHKIDRAGWPEGPWTSEPDRVDFTTAVGFPGLILRNDRGNLCGYVAVPPGHPAHGADYDSLDATVHGGLTYSGECGGPICHVPQPGEPDDVYWLGFDCGHCYDVSPTRPTRPASIAGIRVEYRDVAYVRAEIEGLAAQLKAMAP